MEGFVVVNSKARLIHQFLENSTEHYPDKIALIHERHRVRYDELNLWSNKLANWLIKSDIKPGSRIVMLLENGVEYVFCYYGILKAGCLAISLDPGLKSDGLEKLLNEAKPRVVIASPKSQAAMRPLNKSRFGIDCILHADIVPSSHDDEVQRMSLKGAISDLPDHNPNLSIDEDSCAAIVYTSGSTGKPKGAMLSHSNIVANTRGIIEYLDLAASDIQMVVLPFFYVMGKSLLNTHIAVGGTVVINNQFAYTARVLKQMASEGVTGFSGVPSTYAHLIYKSPLVDYRNKLPSLRYCSQAGGHMSTYLKTELLRILPDHTLLFVMYGATEASARLSYVPPDRLTSKMDSIGVPIPGVTLKIMAPDGRALGSGEVGEIVAQGRNIMIGYYAESEATARVLDGNGYHTGDLGYYDSEGFFYVTGRKDEQLKVGGYRLNPSEIEDIIIDSGLVAECIVFSTEDEKTGQLLAGLIVPVKKTVDLTKRVLGYCHRKLPKYKVPVSLTKVKAIPKNSSQKPDRLKSRELYEIIARAQGKNRA